MDCICEPYHLYLFSDWGQVCICVYYEAKWHYYEKDTCYIYIMAQIHRSYTWFTLLSCDIQINGKPIDNYYMMIIWYIKFILDT